MPSAEEVLLSLKPKSETMLGEPPPFPIEGFIAEQGEKRGVTVDATAREGMASSVFPVVRPFLAQGYNSVSALNRGISVFAEHLDTMSEFLENRGLGKRGEIFKKIADYYDADSKKWRERAEKVGINFVDELVSEAVGGAVPGITEFLLGVPYAGFLGAAEAEKAGENPIAGALIEGAKRYSLGGIFRAIGPLKQYLRTPIMGGVLGLEPAIEGAPKEDIAKAIGAGMVYSITSPGGQMGLNEVRQNLRKQIPKVKPIIPEKDVLKTEPKVEEIVKNKERLVEPLEEVLPIEPKSEAKVEGRLLEEFPERKGEPEIRDRKYWKTVEEAERTAEGAKFVMREIQKEEPQINIVQPNRTSLDKAYKTLEEKGFEDTLKYTYESKELLPVEKGALFNVLMEQSQKVGDWAKFVEVMDSYSLYLVDLGRGVQIASVWTKNTPMGFIKWAEKQLEGVSKKYGWADTLLGRQKVTLTEKDKLYLTQEFMRIQKIPEGIEKSNELLKLVDYVAVKVPPSVSELIDAFRYQNMLSSPRTQERNIMWNMVNTFIARPGDLATAGSIDFVLSGLRGKERTAYAKDALIYYKEAINAVPNALNAFRSSWKMEAGEKMGKPEMGLEYKSVFEQARAKQMPKALTVVQRFMEASDRFNAMLIASGEKAVRIKNGMSEVQAEMFAKSLAEKYLLRDKLDPKDPSLSYFSKAIEGLGVLMQEGRHLPVMGKPLSWFVPFLRTPIKVGVQMIERSPLGLARSKIDLDSAAMLVSGGVATGIGALFAYMGETTWSPPSDPKEKEWFYSSGRKPFSFKVNEKWVPAWYLGPYALAFMFPVAINHYTKETKESLTDGQVEQIASIAEGLTRFISSQTSAQSIGNFFSFMAGDIDYNIKNQLGFALGQAIPASSMVRYINMAIDPIYRKPEGLWEQITKDIPYLSKELTPRVTPFMEESRRDLFNMLLPYDIGVTKEEYEGLYPWIKIEQRMNYLDNKMRKLIEKMGKGEFKDKHFDEMMKIFESAPKVFEPLE